MNDHEAKQYILQQISVSRQQVTLAQSFIIDICSGESNSQELVLLLLSHMESQMPKEVVLHQSVDSLSSLNQAAKSISWRLAGYEAIWKLIHSNLIVPSSSTLEEYIVRLDWTTVVQNSGGHRGGWRFDECKLAVPNTIRKVYSLALTEQPLANHDLYMHEINIANIHPDIELALREAVECFRHELFTSTLAMLSKAAEGSWFELGAALIRIIPIADQSKFEKQIKSLENPDVGSGKKIQDILTVFGHQEIFKPIAEQSSVSLQDLRLAANWSEVIRDSRNTVHFGVEPAMKNTYEKVAALLIGAVPHIRNIYRIKEAADRMT